MYLTRLAHENVRAFENLELSFASAGQPRMTNVVIGRNGTGKSTLLRCVVLGCDVVLHPLSWAKGLSSTVVPFQGVRSLIPARAGEPSAAARSGPAPPQ